MRISLLHFAAIGFVVSSTIGVSAQAPQQEARLHAPQPSQAAQTSQIAAPRAAQHTPREAADNPVADPRAVVVIGNARFTVLTPEMIRMEWAADGKFEDHASFVFINRRLPVPKFDWGEVSTGGLNRLTGPARSNCRLGLSLSRPARSSSPIHRVAMAGLRLTAFLSPSLSTASR